MSEIDIYLTGMPGDVMLLPLIDLFTSSYKDGGCSCNHNNSFKLGV